MCFYDPSRCDLKYPYFQPLFCKPKSYVQIDVRTALIRCLSHLQYWTDWNEAETFEYSRIHIDEIKQGLSSEYQSNFTSMAKRKSMPLIRPNSMRFLKPPRCDVKIPPFAALILQTKVIRTKWCDQHWYITLWILRRFSYKNLIYIENSIIIDKSSTLKW
jgi:hypothetical protein